MTQYFNRTEDKEKRRLLRSGMPPAEEIVWSKLRRKQVFGYRCRRQYSVGPYVVDFYCPALKLAVEIDGDSHFIGDAETNGRQRQTYIESFGITFLRFTNHQVYDELDAVLDTIAQVAQKSPASEGPI